MTEDQQQAKDLLVTLWASGVLPVWLVALAFPILIGAWVAFKLSRLPAIEREDEARMAFHMITWWTLAAVLVGTLYTAQAVHAGVLTLPPLTP